MKIGVGQIVCLIAGVLFLSLGGGLIGGRWAAQRQGLSASEHSSGTSESEGTSLPELEPGITSDDVSVSPPTEEQAEVAPFSVTPPTSVASPTEEPTELAPAPLPSGDASSPFLPTKYVIQTISTSNRSDASTARNRIMAEGFPAGIFEANLGDKGRWYRVYVGPYDSEAEAQKVLESVRRIPGFKASFVKSLD